MSKKLAEKAGLIKLPPAVPRPVEPEIPPPASAPAGTPAGPRMRTAPGTMAAFLGTQSAAVKEAEELRSKLQMHEGSTPARRIDPRLVRASVWANRSDASFASADFEDLKLDIASAGGNVQPVKVRRVPGPTEEYELVYGHRRHRACLQLGLPLLALIDEIDDAQLFVEMERENRGRKDLSAWEQGMHYARALEKGLFPSNRRLAQAIGKDLGDVGKALALAALPKEVVEAFASPLDLQFRFASPLNKALEQDAPAVMERARRLAKMTPRPTPKEVLRALVGEEGDRQTPAPEVLTKDGRQLARISFGSSGSPVAVQLLQPVTAKQADQLLEAIKRILGAH